MKIFYILNNKKKMITGGKIISQRGLLFESLVNVKFFDANFSSKKLNKIYLNEITIENKIGELLMERNSKPLDIPDYKGRFRDEEVFEWKLYKGEELKLCNTGFDSNIIFLIDLYDSAKKDEKPYYIFLANKQGELNDTNLEDMEV
ncbi:hypothetical protein KIM67_12785 [Flagellimonas sp. 389]|uniref:hypothetical protein n=1 Tax=Flagellimonas sp. 389 TaxID=2835862 RepID=UPI001BD4141F|nr:hypothetical protein [Flagellimonas sp. 389]MBS9463286.1 hypothetical protein [Flagellimonas sp. 389]